MVDTILYTLTHSIRPLSLTHAIAYDRSIVKPAHVQGGAASGRPPRWVRSYLAGGGHPRDCSVHVTSTDDTASATVGARRDRQIINSWWTVTERALAPPPGAAGQRHYSTLLQQYGRVRLTTTDSSCTQELFTNTGCVACIIPSSLRYAHQYIARHNWQRERFMQPGWYMTEDQSMTGDNKSTSSLGVKPSLIEGQIFYVRHTRLNCLT